MATNITEIIRKNPLTLLGIVLGGLMASWQGAIIAGFVGFVLDNVFGR